MSIRNHLSPHVVPGSSVPNAGRLQAETGALPSAVVPGAVLPDLTYGVARLADTLQTWLTRQRQRRHLMTLDDHLLGDIGLNRSDAEREYRKPFWRE